MCACCQQKTEVEISQIEKSNTAVSGRQSRRCLSDRRTVQRTSSLQLEIEDWR